MSNLFQNYSRILDIVSRRCPDLFRNCLLLICFADDLSPEGPSNLDYLAQLCHLRPQFICLGFEVHPGDELLRQSVVLNTPHLSLTSQVVINWALTIHQLEVLG